MSRKLTNEEFLEKLKDCGVNDIPLEEYCGSRTSILFECHNNPKHKYRASPNSMYKSGDHCPYCNNREVFVGKTDMWTTDSDLAKMLLNKNDGYKYFSGGSQCVDWVCPNCGNIINKQINRVRLFGLSCDACRDGMSFAEKFVYCMLQQLNCEFIYDKTTKWSNNKKYDFYIPSMSIIIETHGAQHYDKEMVFRGGKRHRSVEEERENDIYKETLAISNGIKYYIQLDCRKSDLSFIRNSILDSRLNTLFDLSQVNWDKCLEFTFTSTTLMCCDLWNSGIKNTQQISDKLGISIVTVIEKLKYGAQIGLCDYRKNYSKSKSVRCKETGKIYQVPKDVEIDGYNPHCVLRVCRNLLKTSGGKHWEFV